MANAIAVPRSVSLRGYHELTKPGITLFVGLTAMAGYVVSARGIPNPVQLMLVCLATILMSAGAATLNQVLERRVDALMSRTARRPLPAGLVSLRGATTFGIALTILGSLLAISTLPPLVFFMLAGCHISYVYWYTPLKQRTELCTLVGAIPGALPVLAGSAATHAPFNTTALALTGLLFAWQIPHFMAIGWLMRDDYGRARFKMLPVTDETGRRTAIVALLYAIATQGFAILLTREAAMHPLMLAVIHTCGTGYIFAAIPFVRRRAPREARRLFFASLIVLPVILGALVLNFAHGATT